MTQARHRVTDCISQVPQEIQQSRNRERWIGKMISGCQRENNRVHRLPQDARSPTIPMRKHRETDCGPRLKEDDDMMNLLSPRVKLIPNLVTRVEEDLKKTLGDQDLTNFPLNTATWCIFAGCQNSSFANT